MMPLPTTQNPKKNSCLLPILLGSGVLLFLLIAAVMIIAFTGVPVQKPAIVNISAPVTGSMVELGQAHPISAMAYAEYGITRLEIYADGSLIKVQLAPSTPPSKLLTTAFAWSAPNTGRHVLTARAYPLKGKPADSPVVFLDVLPKSATDIKVDSLVRLDNAPLPSLQEISNLTGIPVDELLGANPGLQGTPADQPMPPGTVLHIPTPTAVSPVVPSLESTPVPGEVPPPVPGAPTAPDWLTVDASACDHIQLEWTDSPDETAYLVYRRAPGEANLNLVSSLPANTSRLSDPAGDLGTYYYQVAAVRGDLQARSAIFAVELPAACAPAAAPPATVNLSLSIISLSTENRYDGIYCYYALDDGNIDRLPAREPGSLTPNADGNSYPVSTGLPNRGRFLLAGHPAGEPVSLMLKCRGYRGPFSLNLGKVDLSEPASAWDGSIRSAVSSVSPGFTLSYCITTGDTPCGSGIFNLGGLLLPPLETLFHLPAPHNLHTMRSLEICDEAAEFDIPGHLQEAVDCIFSGLFQFGQNTLYWDWEGADSIFTEASIRGYMVTATLTDLSSGITIPYFIHDIRPGSRKFALVNNNPDCGMRLSYIVKTVAAGRVSEASETLTVDTPACPAAVRVHISFDQLKLGPVDDDGDSWIIPPPRDTELEYSGYLIASGGSTGNMMKGSMPANATLGEGTYDLANTRFMNYLPLPAFVGAPNNSLDVIVTGSDQDVTFEYSSSDADDHWFGAAANTYDNLCRMSQTIPHRSIQNWLRYNETFVLDGANTSETSCQVTVHVTAHPVP